MKHHRTSVNSLCVIVLVAAASVRQPLGQAQDATIPTKTQLADIVELPHQTLTFEPTRDDITVGCVILSLHHSDLSKAIPLESIRVDGTQPKTPVRYLKQVGKNQFELPAAKIEFSSQKLGGPLYLTVKVWFNELTNQHDSPFYEHVPDRYALVSYCTKEDESPSSVNSRLGANRVASLREFQERLGKPFVIRLNQRPLQPEWGRWPMHNNRRLNDEDLKAIEQLVRGRGERYLITVLGNNSDTASVHVGDHDFFENTRVYKLTRTDGIWRIAGVEDIVTGW